MVVIKNKILPMSGYKALTLWPFIFVRADETFAGDDNRHEHIHLRQQIEMLIVAIIITLVLTYSGCGWWSLLALPLYFYWYFIEWLVRSAQFRNFHKGYHQISFEREAYTKQSDASYLSRRKMFTWIKYL